MVRDLQQEIATSVDSDKLFAVKLNQLFATKPRPDGRRYSQGDVVQGCQGALTRVYLWKLRTGRATNPSMRVVQALADFFGVTIDYFSGPGGEQISGEGVAPEDAQVRLICEKFFQLDEQGRRVILNLIDYILQLKY